MRSADTLIAKGRPASNAWPPVGTRRHPRCCSSVTAYQILSNTGCLRLACLCFNMGSVWVVRTRGSPEGSPRGGRTDNHLRLLVQLSRIDVGGLSAKSYRSLWSLSPAMPPTSSCVIQTPRCAAAIAKSQDTLHTTIITSLMRYARGYRACKRQKDMRLI